MSFHKLNIRALDTGPAPGRQDELSAWAELLPDPLPGLQVRRRPETGADQRQLPSPRSSGLGQTVVVWTPKFLPGEGEFRRLLRSLELASLVAAQGRAQPGRALLPTLLPALLHRPSVLVPPSLPDPPPTPEALTRLPLGFPLSPPQHFLLSLT